MINVHFVNKLSLEEEFSRAQEEEQAGGESRKPSEVNAAKSYGNESDSSTFSLSITPSICYSDASEWLLDTGLPSYMSQERIVL